MSVAGTNEKKFAKVLNEKINAQLKGKLNFKSKDGGVSISVDDSLVSDEWIVMFEIDSANMAKLIAGQYTLLNILARDDEKTKGKKLLFVIVHYYKNYNSERTSKNLSLINSSYYNGLGIPFRAFSNREFYEYIEDCNTEKDLIEKLTKVQ